MEKIKIQENDQPRLDTFLANRFPDCSRTYFKRLINAHQIQVNQKKVSPNHRLQFGQTISINWPSAKKTPRKKKKTTLPFPILFEDGHMMAINKPAHVICHPPGVKRTGESVVELLAPYLESDDWPDDLRPGLVHRLDRDTSGVLLFAKTPQAHHALSKQFALRQVKKVYQALVQGVMTSSHGTLESKIGRHPSQRQRFAVTDSGRPAVTRFKVLHRWEKAASHVELYPLTGRTHQLRVQLSSYNHPILGDRVYGKPPILFPSIKRQMLHALSIEVSHPKTKKKLFFKAPLPDDFQAARKIIRSLA